MSMKDDKVIAFVSPVIDTNRVFTCVCDGQIFFLVDGGYIQCATCETLMSNIKHFDNRVKP